MLCCQTVLQEVLEVFCGSGGSGVLEEFQGSWGPSVRLVDLPVEHYEEL